MDNQIFGITPEVVKALEMKKICYLFLGSMFFLAVSCDGNSSKKTVIISKIKLKTNDKECDTLWVSQNDPKVFEKDTVLAGGPGQLPKERIDYVMIAPKTDAYYYIYNEYGQLDMEGKREMRYANGNYIYPTPYFYNSKSYSYRNNGRVRSMHEIRDGRSYKTEIYDRKGKIDEIIYFDKKSGNKQKVEIYDDGKLEETRVYKSFDNYDVIKAKD
ncbi:hypothetical protein [Soonwooa sp.]|uniref:hypothetical protein n=1 Tax=Soonwooa sp. TaxID=1938592 RepID=UPI002630626C|nr:hypothetical protein [Soonwooa sp.]